MSKEQELPKIKEKDFMKEIEKMADNMSKTMVVRPSEVEKLKIETEDDCSIAENSLNNIKDNIEIFDTTRMGITKPLDNLKTKIKKLFDTKGAPNLESKSILSSKITTFKQVQRQAALAEQKRKNEEQEQKSEKALKNLKNMNRIENNMYVRLFGGEAVKRDKEGKLSKEKKRPCQNNVDVELAIEWVEKGFPSFDKFSDDMREDAIRVKEMFLMVAKNLKKAFFDAESDHAGTREDALAKIMELNSEYNTEITNRRAERKEKFNSDFESATKAIEKAVKEKQKGFRKDIVFKVINLEAVPDIYKTIDENKIKGYKTTNREDILKAIKDGKGNDIIKGIEFSVNEKFIGSR